MTNNQQLKLLPSGIEYFEDMIREGYYYVDSCGGIDNMNSKLGRMKKRLVLCYRYVFRIWGAKNHLSVPFHKKVKANLSGGYLGDQYVLYDFDKNDRREYISELEWYKSRYINEPFNDMFDNKIICNEVLERYIRVPKIYVAKNQGRLIKYTDINTYEGIIELLQRKKKLFIKPIKAGKGKGVYLLSMQDDQLYIDEYSKSVAQMIAFLKKDTNWLIVEAMEQDAYLNSLYDKTANTIRFITWKSPKTEEFEVFFAVQRIGTKNTFPVDNGSRGGLVANIDLITGELSEARNLHSLDSWEYHPDSGAKIKGAKVPGWDAIKTEMLELTDRFPFMNFMAWDILLTKDGICIIEANTSSGVNIIQLWGGQRNGSLGDFYRHHGIID